ncbi:MAG TPA: hypothetical protein VHC69_22455 [Polyangiaceae bacterium]|nr:hypothetical protein [Polyangiaceae bacterium]
MTLTRRLAAIALAVPALTVPAAAEPITVDRAVVSFVARDTGGVEVPEFVFERKLAFEARLEALAEGEVHEGDPPFRQRHVRAALDRHIAETVLEALPIKPPPTEAEISARMDQARLALVERVGGLVPLREAAAAEGIGEWDLGRLVRRQAIASLYLDRMVAPMLDPSDAELRQVLITQRTPFAGRPFADVAGALRRWYVGTRLQTALSTFYDGLRNRLTLTVLR